MIRSHILYFGDVMKNIRKAGPSFSEVPLEISLIHDLPKDKEHGDDKSADFVVERNPKHDTLKDYGIKCISDGRRFLLGMYVESRHVIMPDELSKLESLAKNYFDRFKESGWDIDIKPIKLSRSECRDEVKKLERKIQDLERRLKGHWINENEKNEINNDFNLYNVEIESLKSSYSEGRYLVRISTNLDHDNKLMYMDEETGLLSKLNLFGDQITRKCRAWGLEDNDYIRDKLGELGSIIAGAFDYTFKISKGMDGVGDIFLHFKYDKVIELKSPFQNLVKGKSSHMVFNIDPAHNEHCYNSMDTWQENAKSVIVPVKPKLRKISIKQPENETKTSLDSKVQEPFHKRIGITKPEIREALDKWVIGQDKAKDVLSSAVYRHLSRIHQQEGDVTIEKGNILLYGPSGTGKTHLVKSLAKVVDVPIEIADATSLTAPGYVGDDTSKIIDNLVAKTNGDIEKAQMGIIFIDEIDKLASRSDSGDVGTTQVQHNLLKLIEGKNVKLKENRTIDTTNILFICGGAFTGDAYSGVNSLESSVLNRLSVEDKKSFGFVNKEDIKTNDINYHTLLDYVTAEDLQKYGLSTEFVGRLHTRVGLNRLTVDELERIITEPKNSHLDQLRKFYKEDHVELNIESDAIRYIAAYVYAKSTGAREIRTVMEKINNRYMNVIASDQKKITVTRTEVVNIL